MKQKVNKMAEPNLTQMCVDAKTTVAATALIRTYLAAQPFGVSLDNTVLELLTHHQNWEHKAKGGVVAVRKIHVYKSFALELVLSSGAIESISWPFAVQSYMREIKGKPALSFENKLPTFIAFAARASIRDQVSAARFAIGGYTGDGKDIDHTNEGGFSSILAQFIAKEKPGTLRPCKPQCSQYWGFTDAEATKRWQEYHREKATYQLISKAEHLKITQRRAAATTTTST